MAYQETRLVDAGEFSSDGNKLSAAVDGLTYLIHSDDDVGIVGLYAGQLEAQVRGLEALLRSADPNMRGVRARLRN
jgi:hypothetical protein